MAVEGCWIRFLAILRELCTLKDLRKWNQHLNEVWILSCNRAVTQNWHLKLGKKRDYRRGKCETLTGSIFLLLKASLAPHERTGAVLNCHPSASYHPPTDPGDKNESLTLSCVTGREGEGGQIQCQTGWVGVDVSEHHWWSFFMGSDKIRRKQRKTNTSESRLQLKATDPRARWQRLVLISCVHTRTCVSDVTKGAEPHHLRVKWVCISTEIHIIHTYILCITAGS